MEEVKLSEISVRTFGWIQDPGRISNLRKVVEIFDPTTPTYGDLKERKIPELIEETDGKNELIKALEREPLQLTYRELVGKSSNSKPSTKCNGLVQVTIPGQKRPFIGDWSADKFVRWAHALGFIRYIYKLDSFEITDLGLEYTNVEEGSQEEKDILEYAFLSYPPVVRILRLLEKGAHLTKFELGNDLGFIGEDGFTSLPQNILIVKLATLEKEEKDKIKSDWEGSADKYAKMICCWLEELGWVEQLSKKITVNMGNTEYTETIPQAYVITTEGLKALRRDLGINEKKIPKNVFWEMLCVKNSDSNHIRTRRALILRTLMKASEVISLERIRERLEKEGFDEAPEAIADDIKGFINIGLNVQEDNTGYILYEDINDFVIPTFPVEATKKSDILIIKEKLRSELKHVPHDYLSLLDISFEENQNTEFELQILNLLVNGCNFKGKHLGKQREPHSIIYTEELDNNFGLITYNKAHSGGYSLPVAEADEMEGYIRENQIRSEELNPNKWWEYFPDELTDFKFVFISSRFSGKCKDQINRIAYNTGVEGSAISAYYLLLIAERILSGELTYDEFRELIEKHCKISF